MAPGLLTALAAGTPALARGLGRSTGFVLAARPLEASVPWIPSLGVEAALRLDGLSLVVALVAAMVGLVLADDLVLLHLFWELTTLCSFALLSTAGAKAVAPGRRALATTIAGGLALLVVVVLLALAGGTTRISVLLADPDAVLSSPFATVVLVVAAALQLFTVPVAGCAVGVAAHRSGAPFDPRTQRDDLRSAGAQREGEPSLEADDDGEGAPG